MCILALLLVFLLIILNIKYKEGTENVSVKSELGIGIGNWFSAYFHELGYCITKKEDFNFDVGDLEFIKYFPSELKYKYDDIYNEFEKNEINRGWFETEKQQGLSMWFVLDKKTEVFWTIMKPLIKNIYDDAFSKSNLVKKIDRPVIHFRCSDIPFNKGKDYTFQKYEFFKKALSEIEKRQIKYDEVIICYCNTHRAENGNQKACDVYAKSLGEYLQFIGYKSMIQCQSNIDDFSTLYHAPACISSGSSFSFMSGFFGNGIYISGGHDDINNKNEPGDWLYKGYNLKHADVPDYHDTDDVITKLSR